MKQRQGFNNTHLRNRNRGLVLQAVACGDALSRIEIARRIGLTKMTVSNIVAEWIAEGVLAEKEVAETAAVGRNPVILEVRAGAPRAVGLYLSRGAASVIVSTLTLEVTYRESLPLAEETAQTLLEKLFRLIDGALAHLAAASPGARCMGIGVSAIGPLDAASGTILSPTDFFGIRQLPLAAELGGRYGLPVVVNNDMNASALAEKLYGTGRAFDNFLYLGVTNGIGSGILSGGRLYQDNSGFVGEIGHMSIDFDGPLCSCGRRGCLETYANMPVILDRLQNALGRAVACADLEEAWDSPAGRAVLEDAADKLAIALINTVNLLDPQCILIGHEGARFPAACIARIEERVNGGILAAGYKTISVAPSHFGPDAPLAGSACCIWQEVFAGHLPVLDK